MAASRDWRLLHSSGEDHTLSFCRAILQKEAKKVAGLAMQHALA